MLYHYTSGITVLGWLAGSSNALGVSSVMRRAGAGSRSCSGPQHHDVDQSVVVQHRRPFLNASSPALRILQFFGFVFERFLQRSLKIISK